MRVFLFYICLVVVAYSCGKDLDKELPPPVDPPAPKLATVVTHPFTDFSRFSIRITGSVTDSGESKVTEAGFVVDTFTKATIDKNLNRITRVPDSSGKMLAIITHIPGNTTYYLRAYAINKEGVAYGNEIVFSSLPENVYNGGSQLILNGQAEVDAFGSKHYNRINATVEITGNVTDLSPLKDWYSIDYGLTIKHTKLTTLKGFDSLVIVNGNAIAFGGIRIEHNPFLKNLNGLDKLTGNKGYLYILHNDELTDLTGLDNIVYNHFGEIRIEDCDKIRNLHGLEKLEWLDGDIMLKDNLQLTDVSAFSNLSFISGRIRLMNNEILQNVNGFEKIHHIDGVELYDNKSLSNLDGFNNIDTVVSIILLTNNSALKDLSCFSKLTTIPYINIKSSPALTSLHGLENITSVTSRLEIWQTGITNFKGLDNLATTPYLEILENENLLNLDGLNKLNKVGGGSYALNIIRNNKLANLSALSNLAAADGQVYMAYNAVLSDFCGLKPLLTAGFTKDFILEGNASNPSKATILSSCP